MSEDELKQWILKIVTERGMYQEALKIIGATSSDPDTRRFAETAAKCTAPQEATMYDNETAAQMSEIKRDVAALKAERDRYLTALSHVYVRIKTAQLNASYMVEDIRKIVAEALPCTP